VKAHLRGRRDFMLLRLESVTVDRFAGNEQNADSIPVFIRSRVKTGQNTPISLVYGVTLH